jgi:membrane protein
MSAINQDSKQTSGKETVFPEKEERVLTDPGLTDLSKRDWLALFKRAGKGTLDDNIPLLASGLAYSGFMAIPALLLLATGLFTLVTGPQAISNFIQSLNGIIPSQAATLLGQSLHTLDAKPGASIIITIVGFILALWSSTGAMSALQIAMNIAYDQKDRRSFIKKRLIAFEMVGCMFVAVALVATLLIFGPVIEHYVGTHLGIQGVLSWVWWVAQWPILITGLLASFATLLYLGPDLDQPKWQFLTPGSLVATLVWIAVSGLFAIYTSSFGSYNKTWGSLSAVIIMLTWLWLTSIALLLGAEINSEAERSRELRKDPSQNPEDALPSQR